VVADVPGLIEGAHEGHGLGTRFLAHLERTKVLVHVIDVSESSERDPIQDFKVISEELKRFEGTGDDSAVALASKPTLVALNKIDVLGDQKRLKKVRTYFERKGVPVIAVSAAT
jgi:GTP-binding protein